MSVSSFYFGMCPSEGSNIVANTAGSIYKITKKGNHKSHIRVFHVFDGFIQLLFHI
jgi:hypothetical protein